LLELLLAAAQFVALPIGHWRRGLLFRDTIPKNFDELETFRSSELEKGSKFRFHGQENSILGPGQHTKKTTRVFADGHFGFFW